MSNDRANCGCEGHAENLENCAYDRLTDLAMEAFPKALVRDTKDIEELILAGGTLLKDAIAVIKAHRKVNEGDALAAVKDSLERLEEAGLL